MSTTIDERVVSMEFDNAKFESNVKTSLSTLDKLKKALNFSGAEKGLEEVEKTSGKIDFKEMNSGLEKAKSGFSALEVIAVSALATITSHVTNAGIALAKSLSIDQVTAGWQKYEEKTNGVATIINNARKELTGEAYSLEEVNTQLEKLNWFTDETSYNFTDMVSNIGKFTSQGKSLETSSTAMQGIATWAAVSGQNASAASRAMFNLSQALGMGAVKVQDWMSIEQANMATQEFKETAIQTAYEVGKLIKEEDRFFVKNEDGSKGLEVSTENFRSTLAEAWFTSDALMATLQKYGDFSDKLRESVEKTGLSASQLLRGIESFNNEDDFSEWTNSIQNDLEDLGIDIKDVIPLIEELSSDEYELGRRSFRAAQEAKTFSDAIGAIKDGVSTAWMNVFETIFGKYDKAKKLWTSLAETGYDVFAEPVNVLNDFLKDFKSLGGFDSVINSFNNLKNAAKQFITPLKESLSGIFPSVNVEQIYKAVESFEKFTEKLILTENQSEKLKKTFSGVTSVISIFIDVISKAASFGFKIVKTLFNSIFDIIRESDFLSFTAKIGEAITKFRTWLNETINFDSAISKIINKIKEWTFTIKSWIKSFTGIETVRKAFSDIVIWFQKIRAMKPSEIFDNIKISLNNFRNAMKNIAKKVKEEGIPAAIDYVKEKLEEFREYIKIKFKPIAKFFNGIWDGVVQTFTKFGIDLEPPIQKIKAAFEKFKMILSRINLGNVLSSAIGIAAFVGIIKIVKKALDMFTTVKDVLNSFASIGEAISGLIKSIKNYINAKALQEAAKSILILAASIGIIAAAAWIISKIPTEKLGSIVLTLAGIAIALGGLSVVLGILSAKGIMSTDVGGNLRDLGLALLAIAGALLIISNIDTIDDPNKLEKAMAILLGTTLTIITFIGILGKLVPKLSKGSGIFIAVAVAILAIAKAAQMMSKIDADKLQGIADVLIEAFLGISALSAVLGAFGVGFSQGAAVLAMAVSLLLIVKVIKEIADLSNSLEINDPEKFAIIVGAVLSAVVIMMAITKLGGANGLSGGAGVLAMVISMILLVGFIKKLGDTPISDINKAVSLMKPIALFFAALMLLTNLAGPNAIKASASLILMSLAIGALALVIIMLSQIPSTDLTPAVVAVVLLGAVFAALLKSSQYAKGATGSIIAMTVAIVAIGILIGILSFIPWQNIIGPVAGLTLIMVALAVLFTTIGKITDPKKALFVILEMISVLGAIALIIYLLSQNTDTDQALKIALSLTAVILAMSVLALACSVLGKLGIKSAIVGLGALGIMLAAFVGLGALAYAASDDIPEDYAERMDKAIGFMEKCGELVGAVLGGLLAGVTDGFGKIGENLSKFMENVQPFIDGISRLDDSFPDKIESLTKGIRRLATAGLINDLTSIFGDSGISGITSDLKEFATAMNTMAAVPTEKIDSVITSIEKITNVDIPSSGGLKSLISGDQSLSELGRQLSVFSGYVNDFTSIDVSKIDSISAGIETIKTSIINFTTNGANVDQFINEIIMLQETVVQSEGTFEELGTSLGAKLGEAFKAELSKISGIAATQINNAASAVRGRYSNFYSAGAYAGQGIVSGLASMWQECYNMGASLASAANSGFRNNLQINSPSRVMFQNGVYAGQGAVNGGLSMVSKVYKAFGEVGNAANDGFSNAIARISDAISSDMDVTPTITPVLDLSEIQNGSKSISGMFGNSSISLGGTANRARNAYVSDDKSSDIEQQPTASAGTVNNFVQNNYSPKALSRIEIYRQTKNLISTKVG